MSKCENKKINHHRVYVIRLNSITFKIKNKNKRDIIMIGLLYETIFFITHVKILMDGVNK